MTAGNGPSLWTRRKTHAHMDRQTLKLKYLFRLHGILAVIVV